ncbi:MAG: hypothetical protein EA357_05195 [Micavibrio sp.]|nr:MAG: hypothetical protein EA357_05195 [Micavibrio sp.]
MIGFFIDIFPVLGIIATFAIGLNLKQGSLAKSLVFVFGPVVTIILGAAMAKLSSSPHLLFAALSAVLYAVLIPYYAYLAWLWFCKRIIKAKGDRAEKKRYEMRHRLFDRMEQKAARDAEERQKWKEMQERKRREAELAAEMRAKKDKQDKKDSIGKDDEV